MMGLHPCSVKDDYEEQLEVVRDWLAVRKFLAIGEIGLDFYWDLTHTEEQYDAFRRQLEMVDGAQGTRGNTFTRIPETMH